MILVWSRSLLRIVLGKWSVDTQHQLHQLLSIIICTLLGVDQLVPTDL